MTFKKSNKPFIQLLLLLFLVMAVSVGVALASGMSAVFTLPKAASISQPQLCRGSETRCDSGLIYTCKNGGWVLSKDCKKLGCLDGCEVGFQGSATCVGSDGLDCPGPTSQPTSVPKPTKAPKLESGCGSANGNHCSSGTCPLGQVCKPSGNNSCGCAKNTKK